MRQEPDAVLFSVPLSSGASVDVYGPPPADSLAKDDLLRLSERRLEDALGISRVCRRGADASYNCHGLTFMGKLGWIGFMKPAAQGLTLPLQSADLMATRAAAAAEEEVYGLLRHLGYAERVAIDLKRSALSLGAPDILPGDVALYKSYRPRENVYRLTHSALVVHVDTQGETVDDIRVLSKFGMLGEYIHSIRARPSEFGDQIEIWSDRRRDTQ